MNKNVIRGGIVIAVLLAVFCVIAFAVPFAHTACFWLGFVFGVIAILAQAYFFWSSSVATDGAKSRFYGFPVSRVGVYYLVAQMIFSLLEMAFAAALPALPAVLINVILAALAIVGCITVETMRDEITKMDEDLKQKVSSMRELQSLAAALVGQCGEGELKAVLTRLAEEFRYSDPVSSPNTWALESDMRIQLEEIQQAIVDGDEPGAKALCAKAASSLKERNRLCSMSK